MIRFCLQWFFVVILVFSAVILPRRATILCNREHLKNDASFPVKKEASDVIRVISYNIRGDSPLDKQMNNGWHERKEKIKTLIRHYEPDLMALQGVKKFYIQDFYTLFPHYTCYAIDTTVEDKDVAILFRSSRFSIKKKLYFWLSERSTNNTPPPNPSWGGKQPRIVLQLDLFDHVSEERFSVLATHFDSRGMESRINGAKVVAKHLATLSLKQPIVLAGDFNFINASSEVTEKSEQAYNIIANSEHIRDVRDGMNAKHFGPDGTWIGWEYDKYVVPKGQIGERLDHMFIRGVFCYARRSFKPKGWLVRGYSIRI